LSEKDVKLVLLQHADGKLALLRGDVDAWAGLDPIMASAEIESGAKLFYRKPENNTWGVLNTTETFAKEHPDIVKRVIAVYEQAREDAIKHPDALKAALVEAAKLPENVIDKQLERTDLTKPTIGAAQSDTILAAGKALQKAGVIPADVDVDKVTNELVDTDFAVSKTQ
jgi:sulfonate transport system substrate-binding protein